MLASFFKTRRYLSLAVKGKSKKVVTKTPKFFQSPFKGAYLKSNARWIQISTPDIDEIDNVIRQKKEINVDTASRDSLEALTGLPQRYFDREAVIYKEVSSAMQQGRANTFDYIIRFDTPDQWKNPYMGWTSSRDPVRMLRLKFTSEDAAIRFSVANGLKYRVEKLGERKVVEQSYADNFKYVPNEQDSTTSDF